MGLLNFLFGKPSKNRKLESKVKTSIDPKIKELLDSIEIRETDFAYKYVIGANVLIKYGEPLKDVIQKIDLKTRRNNGSFYLNAIDKFGPERFREVFEWTVQKFGINIVAEDKINFVMACQLYDSLREAEKNSGETKEYKLKFYGQVQGVGFRGNSNVCARICSLKYTDAKNLDDGTVETNIQGSEKLIDVYIDYLKRNFKIYDIKIL